MWVIMKGIRIMVDEVKTCVDAKLTFWRVFSVPDDLKSEMDMFIKDTQSLGEQCSSASEFEQQFSTSELLNRFNTLVSKCIPKAKKWQKKKRYNQWKSLKIFCMKTEINLLKMLWKKLLTEL